jgi:osmotically-inducible protein OsmY
MKSDEELRSELMDLLDTIPDIEPSDIDVQVERGMVTLGGRVDNHQTRFQVERMVRRAPGVTGLSIAIRTTGPTLHVPERDR